MVHIPVLLEEVIENLNLKPGMTVVDGTLGAGGHSTEILKRIMPGGTLVSIDWDPEAVQDFKSQLQVRDIPKRKLFFINSRSKTNVPKRPANFSEKCLAVGDAAGNIGWWCGVHDNYSNLRKVLRGLGIKTVNALVLDLGFSSDQIENADRGFSFSKKGRLDMRYSPESQDLTASEIVNEYSENELTRIFRDYGEERNAARIARVIVRRRAEKPFAETTDLAETIGSAVSRKGMGKIHPATKIFQALRIEVNHEFDNISQFLDEAIDRIASEGRLAIISFHSLEDRLVKNYFRKESRKCICPDNAPKCVCGHQAKLRLISKKPIIAGLDEVARNPRSRSAKLRVAEKI